MSALRRAIAEFGQQPGTVADRLGHQSVWKFNDDNTVSPDYAAHVADCDVCRDLDASGDGLGNSR